MPFLPVLYRCFYVVSYSCTPAPASCMPLIRLPSAPFVSITRLSPQLLLLLFAFLLFPLFLFLGFVFRLFFRILASYSCFCFLYASLPLPQPSSSTSLPFLVLLLLFFVSLLFLLPYSLCFYLCSLFCTPPSAVPGPPIQIHPTSTHVVVDVITALYLLLLVLLLVLFILL